MAHKDRDEPTAKKKRSRGRSSGGTVRRMLGLLAFLPVASRAPLYARLVFALVVDDRVPNSRKAMLAGALGYVALGRDIVPDDIPVLGGLDDLVVVAVALDVFLDGIDEDVLDEKLVDLGIDRAAFDEDIARIRRFLPGPIRRTLRRVPGLLGTAGVALQHSGLGPRLRAWITREDSIA
ncbi:MAG: YkvA family protein [Candidatus Limnocylindrales bacterium]